MQQGMREIQFAVMLETLKLNTGKGTSQKYFLHRMTFLVKWFTLSIVYMKAGVMQMARRTTPNTSRRPTGDTATNARKRFYRAAERYLKQAASSAGATAARYRELARQKLDDALKTYSKGTTQPFSKPIQSIASALGVDLNQARETIKSRSDETAEKMRKEAIKLGEESKSFRTLEGVKRGQRAETLRQDEARAILNSPIGQRIIGGTVEIWQDAATVNVSETETKIDNKKILPELYKYFGVDNLADLLEEIESITGEVLYEQGDREMMYEAAKLTLQNHIAANNSAIA